MSKRDSKHPKMPSSPSESIVFEYSDPDGTRRKESFCLFRTATEQQSLIELAENTVSATRKFIVEGALHLQAELRIRAHSGGRIVASMCEMSALRDLNPWGIESFTDLVVLSKTLALIRETRPENITYLGDNHLLDQCLRTMATAESVDFVSKLNHRANNRRPRWSNSGRLRKSPLLHLLREVTVHSRFDSASRSSSDFRPKIALVAPFAHLDVEEKGTGLWSSGYFGKLPDVLVDSGYDVILVHHPVPAVTWRERRRSRKAMSNLSLNSSRMAHLPTRPPISLRQALSSWRDWRVARGRIADILKEMDDVARDSGLGWLWNFLRPSVERGLFGYQSLVGLATKAAMEADGDTFRDIDRWVVASENQPWEHSFVSTRRQEGHTRFDAFVHVPVRTWDFRIFTLAGEIASGPEPERPTFDRLLVTSPLDQAALASFVSGQHQIYPVEALRFRGVAPPSNFDSESGSEGLLVVLGDYDRLETELVTRVAEAITLESGNRLQVEFRPHPLQIKRDRDLANRVTNGGYRRPEKNLRVISVIASSRTSALYPYLHAGYQVVIALGRASLNFCPILEFPRLRYFPEPSAWTHETPRVRTATSDSPNFHDLLFLDADLPRWQLVLANTRQ